MVNADRPVEIEKVLSRLQQYQLADFDDLALATTKTRRTILKKMIKGRARTISLIHAWMKKVYLKGN